MFGPAGPEGGPRPPFTVAIAQGYGYKIYKTADPSSGIVLAMVTCTTTNDPFMKTCTAPLPPAYNVTGLSLDMTAIVAWIETPHSNVYVVPPPLTPPPAPANLRTIQTVAAAILHAIRHPIERLANLLH
jgi:hypothetical protein